MQDPFVGQIVSETWELSVREDEIARVLNGDAEGAVPYQYDMFEHRD